MVYFSLIFKFVLYMLNLKDSGRNIEKNYGIKL